MNNFISVLAIILIFVLFLRVKYGSNYPEEEVEIVKEKIYDTYKPRRNKKTILRYSVK